MSELISREALMNTIENLTASNQRLMNDNDQLRFILAKTDLDCIYCGLPKKDMAKCAHGFPGCGRADDLLMEDTDGREPEPTV
jgi:hypothetical protein